MERWCESKWSGEMSEPGNHAADHRRRSRRRRAAGATVALLAVLTGVVAAWLPAGTVAQGPPSALLAGRAFSAGRPLVSARVTLYRTGTAGPVALGSSLTGRDGSFRVSYPRRLPPRSVLYVTVGRGAAVRLAAALGVTPAPRRVTVNERTTVAMGFALAQFISGSAVRGTAPGPQNGAAMAGDLANVRTGAASPILLSAPNGPQTSSWPTFNSLANMLVRCVRSANACGALFRLARPPGGRAPKGTLAAIADIATNPAHNVRKLFALAHYRAAPYRPALRPTQIPDAWTLALRFDGNGHSLNGPGNMAIDARGDVWVTNNYSYSRNPLANVCGSREVFKFTPTGRSAPGSPYTGGGLNGAGFGITLDPRGNVWVGNFGFAAEKCTDQPPHKSVSEFTAAGKPLSPNQTARRPGGFTQGRVSWPQGTVSDRDGNIWIANCANNSVTRYAGGNPNAAQNFRNLGISKPFDIAINRRGQVFVTGNGNSAVAMLNPNGTLAARSPITGGGLDKPFGIAADIQGNMWIANSGVLDVPCPDENLKPAKPPSITLLHSNGKPDRAGPFTGGGLIRPWGVAVDGHDNVWVANFGGQRLSEFCGTEAANCPRGLHTGEPITPSSGYGFDGLVRNTGVQIDPSGNVWLANNWKNHPIPARNPGGYQVVVFIGLAGPIKTPLIGPPRPL
jgi:hypothetical protein